MRLFSKLILGIIFCLSCQNQQNVHQVTNLLGETMGTYYRVVASDPVDQAAVDSILVAINREVNTYDSTSVISAYNSMEQGDTLWLREGPFLDNLKSSEIMWEQSRGYFNPCIGPLVRFWGFDEDRLRSENNDSLLPRLLELSSWQSLDMIRQGDEIQAVAKKYTDQRLDFNAIAKGYAVDEIAEYLERREIENYQVDIGGEVRIQGQSPRAKDWVLAINTPLSESELQDAFAYVSLPAGSVATSGNYRNFYKKGDSVVVHTINPFSGRSERNSLLSATVIAPTCQVADALATACMSADVEEALSIINDLAEVEVYLIYLDETNQMRDTMSYNMNKYIIK